MLKLRKNKKGFTLVELIVVIAIMAVLAGTIAGVTVSQLNKQTNNSAQSEVNTLMNDFKTFVLDYDGEIKDATTLTAAVAAFAEEAKGTQGAEVLFATGSFKAGDHKFIYTIDDLKVTFSCNKKGSGGGTISAEYTYTDILA